jgi:hypothetical protein
MKFLRLPQLRIWISGQQHTCWQSTNSTIITQQGELIYDDLWLATLEYFIHYFHVQLPIHLQLKSGSYRHSDTDILIVTVCLFQTCKLLQEVRKTRIHLII